MAEDSTRRLLRVFAMAVTDGEDARAALVAGLRRGARARTPMLRDRLLHPRWLVWVIVLWGIAIGTAPRVDAAPLPPARADGVTGDLDRARALLDARAVRVELAALGVSEADTTTLWERLTPAERAELAARAKELAPGGDPVAAAVAIAIVVAMFVILALELIGRRIISRPATGAQP